MDLDINDIRSLVTLVSFVLFCALIVWTWLPRRRGEHEEAARLVFEGESDDDLRRPSSR